MIPSVAAVRTERYSPMVANTRPIRSFVRSPATLKHLIGKALTIHPAVEAALKSGTVVIIAGTTNGYVAEEINARTGQAEGFSRKRFFRGITIPPGVPTNDPGMLHDMSEFMVTCGIGSRPARTSSPSPRSRAL